MSRSYRYLALVLLLNACSTPFRIVVPALRFESPEISGPDENLEATFGLQNYNYVELTPSVQTIPIHSSPSTLRQRFMADEDDPLDEILLGFAYVYFNVGFRPAAIPVEFSFTFPSTFNAKFQILGDNAQDAKSGNFSIAVTGAWATRGTTGGSISEDETPEPGYYQYEFSRNIYDVSAIIGYRVTDNVLLYGGPFLFHTPYSMRQNLTSETGYGDEITGAANSYGGNFGIQFGNKNYLKAEVSVNTLNAYQSKETFIHGGIAAGRHF